jgi:hypothetical protein
VRRRYSLSELGPVVRRSGCTITAGTALPDGDTAWSVECPTHAAKVLLLANLAELDSRQPEIIQIARDWAGDSDRTIEGIAEVLHARAQDAIAFLPEPVELFRPASTTIELGAGDCDCSARALLALYRAAGLQAGLATLGKPPTHVAPVVKLAGAWTWAETSLRGAMLGEHPIAAARRLGVSVRPELAQADLGDTLADLEPEERTTILVQMAGAVAIALVGELASVLSQWRRPPLAEVATVAIVGAWTPVILHGIDRWIRKPRPAQ